MIGDPTASSHRLRDESHKSYSLFVTVIITLTPEEKSAYFTKHRECETKINRLDLQTLLDQTTTNRSELQHALYRYIEHNDFDDELIKTKYKEAVNDKTTQLSYKFLKTLETLVDSTTATRYELQQALTELENACINVMLTPDTESVYNNAIGRATGKLFKLQGVPAVDDDMSNYKELVATQIAVVGVENRMTTILNNINCEIIEETVTQSQLDEAIHFGDTAAVQKAFARITMIGNLIDTNSTKLAALVATNNTKTIELSVTADTMTKYKQFVNDARRLEMVAIGRFRTGVKDMGVRQGVVK